MTREIRLPHSPFIHSLFYLFLNHLHKQGFFCAYSPPSFFRLIFISFFFYCSPFKKRAPKAIRAIKEFAKKTMGTRDVRLDVSVNKFVWSKGVRSVPHRIRVNLTRKANEDEDAREKMYTLVTYVPVETFKGLSTKVVEEQN